MIKLSWKFSKYLLSVPCASCCVLTDFNVASTVMDTVTNSGSNADISKNTKKHIF